MKTTCYASFAVALASVASAHMEMSYPPPLKSKFNPSSGSNVDYSMTSPLHADGSDYPCKGYLSLLGTPTGAPVASWTAGESHNMTIVGGAVHGGGSCQASVSVDGGKTFRVVHSYVGGCPSGASSSFAFQLPADVPASKAGIFAWTWNNNLGNREMYMNCAIVDIAGGSGGSSGVAFDSRPAVFVADVGNGCTTLDSANVLYPDPGPDVTGDTSTAKPPIGASCGTVVAAPPKSPGSGAAPPSPSGASPPPDTPASGSGSGVGSKVPLGGNCGALVFTPGSGSGSSSSSSSPTSQDGCGSLIFAPESSGSGDSGAKTEPEPPIFAPGNSFPPGFNSAASEEPAPGKVVAVALVVTLLLVLQTLLS